MSAIFRLLSRTASAIAFALFATTCGPGPVSGQPPEPPEAVIPEVDSSRRKIQDLILQVRNTAKTEPLRAAELFDTAWELAVKDEDPFIDLKTEELGILVPGQHQVDAGSRAQLTRLFEKQPAAFRRAYENHASTAANRSLAAAANLERRQYSDVIQRYQFTTAGQRALQALIQLYQSRGEYLRAALQSGRWMRLTGDNSVDRQVHRALLWWNAGLPDESRHYLRETVAASPGASFTIGQQEHVLPDDVAEVDAWLTQLSARHGFLAADETREDWRQPLGDYRRVQNHHTIPPDLSVQWSASSFECAWNPDLERLLKPSESNILRDAAYLRDRNSTIIPAAQPLIVGDLVIYRGVCSIRAVNRHTGKLAWESLYTDQHLEAALDAVDRDDSSGRSQLDAVVATLRSSLLHHLVRANVGGQLTSAGNVLFAVEESTVETMQTEWDNQVPRAQRAVNYLRAYDLQTGQSIGLLGGTVGLSSDDAAPNPLRGYYVLGAPLVLGDRIYVMAENDQGIYLLQLLVSQFDQKRPPFSLRPVSSQLLSVPRHQLRVHPVRMYSGVSPAFGHGLLICNTCDEKIVAISAEDHSVRWMYRYSTNVVEPELGQGTLVIGNASSPVASSQFDLASRWRDALPRIVGNDIIVTPRDSDQLICLDLESGQHKWSIPRGPLRQIIHADEQRVILAGTEQVVCLNTNDGTLQWQHQVSGGWICGTAAANEKVAHIPTSEPAVLTLDITTGRRLLSQPVPGGPPGNLICTTDQLIAQSLTELKCLAPTMSSTEDDLQIAAKELLNGNIHEGEQRLLAMIENGSRAEDVDLARKWLIESDLESLRLDYRAHKDRVPRIRRLIADRVPQAEDIQELTRTMLGLTPARLESVTAAWNRVDRSSRHLEMLYVLSSRHQLQDPDEPADTVASHIIMLLDQAAAARSSFARNGTLTQQTSRISAAAIRTALAVRSPQSAAQVRNSVAPLLSSRIRESESMEDRTWWLQTCLYSGFPEIAAQIVAEENGPVSTAVRDLILLTHIDQPTADAAAATTLLQSFERQQRTFDLSRLLSRSQRRHRSHDHDPLPVSVRTTAGQDFMLPASVIDSEQLETAIRANASTIVPWNGTPSVIESAARSIGPMIGGGHLALQKRVPLYESGGLFSGWFFTTREGTDELHAWDHLGNRRWNLKLPQSVGRYGFRFNRLCEEYVVAWGSLLAVKRDHMLFMLDCSVADEKTPPQLLWQQNFAGAFEFPTIAQQANPAYQRTSQYDLQPAGLFPVGPVTPLGIPVYCGRRMILFDVITGKRQWQVDGLPEDCTLTTTDSHVLLISESSGTIEARGLIDGEVHSQTPLPGWWTEAAENSNASIQDFEIEPGEQQRWRLSLQQGQCLIYRRDTRSSHLEMLNLIDGRTAWTLPMPQDTVVSNVVDGHIALLSNGHQLRVIDLKTASVVSDQTVPAAQHSRYLHLRPAGGQWIVLTSVFDQEYEDQNAVSATTSVQINGPVYAIDQQSGALTWSIAVEHRWLRILNPAQGPFPPVTPLLVLLKQPYRRGPTGIMRGATVQADIYDARTGKVLYEDDNLGYGLSYHRLKPDAANNQITIDFDKRSILFDYNTPAE